MEFGLKELIEERPLIRYIALTGKRMYFDGKCEYLENGTFT